MCRNSNDASIFTWKLLTQGKTIVTVGDEEKGYSLCKKWLQLQVMNCLNTPHSALLHVFIQGLGYCPSPCYASKKYYLGEIPKESHLGEILGELNPWELIML